MAEQRDARRHRLPRLSVTLGDIPAIVSVADAGYDELLIHVALWPTADAC